MIKTMHAPMLAVGLMLLSPLAQAEVVNLTNSAEGATKDAAVSEARKKLQDACTDRKGKPDPASFEVVFERTSTNPDVPKPHYVDAKLKCDLP
ncbi:hypothetical protein [Pseudoxanthomonas composti]|uniref:hypothetical protein n=1 Tax=Pseudoxanthomonas composti TaxID=2137479 RepID=UPI0019D71350|nr:hypothetical protein [Pseudoxanthomonas composti]